MKLDPQIINQLKTVFEKLENSIVLSYYTSNHEKQNELVELLEQVASTSTNIDAKPKGSVSDVPRFGIESGGQPNGVGFIGVPGGHEFTSLILAILNSDYKGKLPDSSLQNRIKKIQGTHEVKTYISLSCENCPEVVQALNLIAILNPGISHTMVDGEFDQESIKKMNIQGVPAVSSQDQLISSGKTTLIELIEKLEDAFGTDYSAEGVELGKHDIVIVGSGPAGVTSAIYCARKGMDTAIVGDRLGGQLQDTKGIENMISIPYIEGPELSSNLDRHMSEYQVKVHNHRKVAKIEVGAPYHKLFTSTGETLLAKRVILATGAKWRELQVPGEKEYLGRGVAFCPHCDGPYYKGKKIAVIGGGNSGVEAAIDLSGIVESVDLVERGDRLKADEVLVKKAIATKNINIRYESETQEILGDGQKVTGLKLKDNGSGEIQDLTLDGVFVQIGLIPNSDFVKGLVETSDYGEILVDHKCETNIERIYAAGDVTNVPYKQIVIAVGEGSKAGLTAFEHHMLSEES